MQDIHEETRATARLPNLDIEIVQGRSADGAAEYLSLSLRAMPSFDAFGRAMEAANPFLFWMRLAQTAWAPWLGAFSPSLPPGRGDRLPAPLGIVAGPDATHRNERAR